MQQTTRTPRAPFSDRPTFRGEGGVHTLEDLQKRVSLLERLFQAGLSFGVPVSITELGVASGQRVGNMRGSWVRKSITALGNNTFTHNLELTAPTGVVNVLWPIVMKRHDGNQAGTGDTIDVVYQGGTITANAIDLFVVAGGSRLVSAGHPLTLDIFFTPADG